MAVNTATLIANLKTHIPGVIDALPDNIKAAHAWPTANRVNALAPANIEDFFRNYFDSAHIRALEAAAAQKPALMAVLPFIQPYENKKAEEVVTDPDVIRTATATLPPPAAAPIPGTAPAPGAAAPVAPAAAAAGFQYTVTPPTPVVVQQPPVVVQPGAGQPPAQPPAVSQGAVANPPPPGGRLPSGEYENDDDAPGPKKKGKDWGKMMEDHPMLAGMGIGLAILGAKAATGKATFDDLFLFLAIGALGGFLFDKFNKNISDGRDEQMYCRNDEPRGCAPRDLPPSFHDHHRPPMHFNPRDGGHRPTQFLRPHHGHGHDGC